MRTRSGFSLIEFMVALVITITLAGGFTLALNNITQGTRNAARSTDLTNLSRGVFKIMQADIYNASKAFSDLNLYQIHCRADTGADMFYGISDLDRPGGIGDSELELQWFDYHREWTDINGVDYSVPTFMSTTTWLVDDPSVEPGGAAGGGVPWTSPIPSLNFMSPLAEDPELKNLEAGDYILLYRNDLLYDIEANSLQNMMDHIDTSTGLWDENELNNGAILLQVAGVANSVVDPEYEKDGENFGMVSAVSVSFGGPRFSSNIDVTDLSNYTEPETSSRYLYGHFETYAPKAKQIKPPEGAWLARKVGESRDDIESLNRVFYYIDTTSETLVRSYNGSTMVLASNVESFDITVGLDVTDLAESWDGAVKMEEDTYWIGSFAELPFPIDHAKALVGRHALAVKINITFKTLREDSSDTDLSPTAGDRFKRRTFEQVIRLKNSHLPMGSL